MGHTRPRAPDRAYHVQHPRRRAPWPSRFLELAVGALALAHAIAADGERVTPHALADELNERLLACLVDRSEPHRDVHYWSCLQRALPAVWPFVQRVCSRPRARPLPPRTCAM